VVFRSLPIFRKSSPTLETSPGFAGSVSLNKVGAQLDEVAAGVLEVRIDVMEGIRQRRAVGKLYLQLVSDEIAQTVAELQEIAVELEKAGADFVEVAVDFDQIVLDFKILRDLESRRSTLGRKIVNQLDEVAAETGEVSPERTKSRDEACRLPLRLRRRRI
jgi:hypothetical protein